MARRDLSGDYGMSAPMQGQGANGARTAPVSPLEELMRRKGVDDAWSALEEMQKQGLTSDRFTVSRMLMKTVGDGKARMNPAKVYRGVALVERFIQYQPEEADEVLFNALLDTCCRIKDICRLDATVQRMKELQILPSHVTLGILVKAYGQAGDISRVLKVWDDMAEQRRQANAVTFGCMIDACVKCGQMEKAMEIFHDMKRRRKHRNTILYTTLIKGCGLEKDLRTALTLFREMRDEGVPYNTITYNSIIDVCIKCSDVQTAEELLREMLAPGNSIEPDLITYSTLLKGYCHVGDLDKALQVAETIKACGLKCDELVYNTLMDGCVKANDLSAGIGLFAEMTQAGMKPSSITHSILVRLYQRNGYKGDCFDAVALLYQHHGLERPNGVGERGGKGNNGGRRGDRGRNNHHNNHRDQFPNGGAGSYASRQNHNDNGAGGFDAGAGWDQGARGMQAFPGPLAMPPHMASGYGQALPPGHLGMMGQHDASGRLACRENELDPSIANMLSSHGSLGSMPFMHMEALQRGLQNHNGMQMPGGHGGPPTLDDRGMAMYMNNMAQSDRGMAMGGPPGTLSWPPYGMNGMTGPTPHLGGQMVGPHAGMAMGATGLEGPHGPLGTYPRRFPPRGRDDGLDASRMGAPMLDPNLTPWAGNGWSDAPFPGAAIAPGAKGYSDRMAGMVDGSMSQPPMHIFA